jgi:hypothetical protein
VRTTARIAALMPGASPPLVTTAICFILRLRNPARCGYSALDAPIGPK